MEESFPIVVGLAIVEREAWVIAGFDPRDEIETARLEAERQNLGFQPHFCSHKLTASDSQAKRSPKRVLDALTTGDPDRERHCWQSTTLATLRERGTDNGLADYLGDIQTQLAPLLGHSRLSE